MVKLSRIWRFEVSKPLFEVSKPKTSKRRNGVLKPENTDMVSISDSVLSDDDLETIDADIGDQEIEPIAEILKRRDKPWYTKAELKNILLTDYNVETSRPTIKDRLETLMAKDLVDVKEAGDTHIFYWSHEESEWPIPRDVVLQSEYNDLIQTFDTSYAWYLVFGILGILVGGVLTLIGAVASAGIVSVPINPDNIIAVALLTLFFSYVSISIYLVVALVDITVDSDLPSFIE